MTVFIYRALHSLSLSSTTKTRSSIATRLTAYFPFDPVCADHCETRHAATSTVFHCKLWASLYSAFRCHFESCPTTSFKILCIDFFKLNPCPQTHIMPTPEILVQCFLFVGWGAVRRTYPCSFVSFFNDRTIQIFHLHPSSVWLLPQDSVAWRAKWAEEACYCSLWQT